MFLVCRTMWMPSHWLRIQFSISDKDANTFKTLLVVSF